jgi:opacity protein-like surface antigen
MRASGGLAWSHFTHTGQYLITQVTTVGQILGNGTVNSTITFDGAKFGWVAGVGGEYAFGPNFSIFTELLYLSFPTKDYDVFGSTVVTGIFTPSCPPFKVGTAGTCSFQTGENMIVGRLGAKWRFNWGVPTYAKN